MVTEIAQKDVELDQKIARPLEMISFRNTAAGIAR